MNTSNQLQGLQGHVTDEVPTSGQPTRIWIAVVNVVNSDGTLDCRPVQGRATKVGVRYPSWYAPATGDEVLVCDVNGDPKVPVVISPLTGAITDGDD